MKVSSPQFKAKVVTALADPHLRDALGAIADHLPFSADDLLACVLQRFQKKGEKMVDLNRRAFAAGRAAVGTAEAATA